MELAPIIIFSYNRPSHLKKTLNSLKKNKLSKKSKVYFFSDGPKTKNLTELKKINLVRKIIKNTKNFKCKEFFFHKKNVGLKKNILNGVTKILKKHKKVIILEDDIIVTKYFLDFMNQSLSFYTNKKKIWHISGWNYDLGLKREHRNDKDAFFIKNMNCWGWGTWRNRWDKLIVDPNFFYKKMNKKDIENFNLSNSINNWSQLMRNKNKTLKTWAIYWNATIFYYKGLCLNPKISMINNIGMDGSGTNSIVEKIKIQKLSKIKNFNLPTFIKEDLKLRGKIISHMNKRKWQNLRMKVLSFFK
jgi:hypothetical protein